MGEDNHKHIPVLDDVVELGSGVDPETGEESIRIVADNTLEDAFDDPYDDEFKKLFDHATDAGDDIDPAQLSIEELDASDDDTPQSTVVADATTAIEDDNEPGMPDISATDEVVLTTDVVTDRLNSNAAEDELWLSDWQEETATNAVIEQQDKTAGDELDILHTKAEIEITDEETAALIAAAVEEDDIPLEADAPKPAEATVEPQAAPVTPTAAHIDTGELVNQIVAELLPEIEWKLRTKVREVLEQHFPPEDD